MIKKIINAIHRRAYDISIFFAMLAFFIGASMLGLAFDIARYFIFSGVVFFFWGVLNKVGAIAEVELLARERAKSKARAEQGVESTLISAALERN